MRKSIATVCLSGTLGNKLEAIAAARFDAVEMFENDLIYCNDSPRAIAAMAADLGLGIDLYQPFRDFEGVPDALFRRNLDRAERKFDTMAALGAPMLLLCSNVATAVNADRPRAVAQLHALAERAAARNLRIGYEALAWGRHVRHYADAWAIVREADHPHLGLIVDSFHILSLGDDPAGIADIPGDKIFFLQLADAPRLAMDVLQWSRHYRCFPGQGQLDLTRFLEQVLIAGYSGPLSLEIFNDVFREAPNRRTAIDAMTSLLFLEAETRARFEAARRGAGCATGRGLAPGRAFRSTAGAGDRRHRVCRICRRRPCRSDARGAPAAARIRARRSPPLQERHALPPGGHSSGPQRRARFLRSRLLRRARPLDLRAQPAHR